MILHVTFSDGSNPWVFYGDRQQVAKHWKRWTKYHPGTAQPVAFTGDYAVYPHKVPGKYKYKLEIRNYNDFDGNMHYNFLKHYKTLGHALRALERLGGGEQ